METTIFAVAGAIIGSFLNVVIYRVPRGQSIVRPASACPACGAEIRPIDNVPVVSYALRRGRCRACGSRISPRYLVVELVTIAVFVLASLHFESVEVAAFVAAVSASLIALSMIDLEHKRLPNVIVLPSAAAALVWIGVADGVVRADWPTVIEAAASGAVAFTILFVIALVSRGMGMGDVKLALFTGLATGRFGADVAAVGLMSGFFVGGFIAIALLATRRTGRKDAIPFGPSLAIGALIALLAGPEIAEFWLGT